MSALTEAAAADEYCRMLADRHYENFSVASKLLRGRVRRDLVRFYAYCRVTDDLGDETPAGGALGRLARWRAEVVEVFAGAHPVHPVLLALRESIAHYQLPAQPFLDLIAANVQDQQVCEYASWPELRAYCMLSAAPVGRVVLRFFGLSGLHAQALSDDVCIGLQLANHAQDVSRDAAVGRSYLLRDDVQAGGTPAAVRALCDRAQALLASGLALEAMAPAPLRMQLALYRLGGLAICDAVRRGGYRTDVQRPQIGKALKIGLAARALLVRFARPKVGNAQRV